MNNPDLTARLAKIRLVAMDVDGTYTNGQLFYDADGQVSKSFHCHDGFAMELLKYCGIMRGFVTGRMDSSTRARANYLGVDFILDNSSDKKSAMESLQKQFALSAEQCLFIGDDVNDIPAFRAAGLKVAVSNATVAVKSLADIVTTHAGGDGAVREVVDMILAARNIDPVNLWCSQKTGPGAA